ncbi:aminotransferase class IV family protein [Roseovarius sp. E0-M6]|uniref:aminotransferase class IV family protein n=1 Tax=Roseovarius sp. E0-M6 TaxID=3127118 RepID=UPI00300FC051
MEGPVCPPDDPGFRLIETLHWAPDAGFRHGARHLARLERAAARMGIDTTQVPDAMAAVRGDGPLRVRLTVAADGRAETTAAPFTPLEDGAVWRVAITHHGIINADDPWRRVKSTQRGLYDAARADLPENVDEVIFLNDRGRLCEGSITSLFVAREGHLLTPPVSEGALPGILREVLLSEGRAREAPLEPEDLQGAALYVGNALRGLIPARMTDD